ncbi:MAG: hypothetical protein Q4G26_08850 [Paracoccus sp. (in: a-proteobacteria)]|nr:hypothetical protein [Paracoccus sp. (in: a-proteobacteria)]
MSSAQGWAAFALAGCAALAVIAGLAISGGPMQARAEKRDAERLRDLRRINANITCQLNNTGQLPESPAKTDACPADIPAADQTGAAYTYTRTDDRHWRICAAFENPALLPGGGSDTDFDAGAGCLVGSQPLRREPFPPYPESDPDTPPGEPPADPAATD